MAEAIEDEASPSTAEAPRPVDSQPRPRQDHPRRGGQRRPPRPRPRRRRGRGVPRDRAQGTGPRPLPGRPPRRRRRPSAPGPVVVLDFGSQFAQLIARRVRELDVYSELLPHDTPYEELERRGTQAIILSGGPNSVYDDDAPKPDPAIWGGRIPVLGICYGAQLMARELGGDVLPAGKREYGPANVHDHDRRRPVRRHRAQPAGLDEPRRLDHAAARRVRLDRPDRLDAVRRPAGPGPEPVRHPVPPRGRPHAARQGRAAQLRGRHRRASTRRGRPPTSSTRPSPASASGSTRHAAEDRLGRQGHLRAVRRRRLAPSRRPSSIARSAIG